MYGILFPCGRFQVAVSEEYLVQLSQGACAHLYVVYRITVVRQIYDQIPGPVVHGTDVVEVRHGGLGFAHQEVHDPLKCFWRELIQGHYDWRGG